MKKLRWSGKFLLAIAVSLMVPAYAQVQHFSDITQEQKQEILDALDGIDKAMPKTYPPMEEQKQILRDALEREYKAFDAIYGLDKKPKHPRHPVGKAMKRTAEVLLGQTGIGQALRQVDGLGPSYYPANYSNSSLPSLPSLVPTSSMGTIIGPPSSAAPAGMYPYSQMGNVTTFPLGLPH